VNEYTPNNIPQSNYDPKEQKQQKMDSSEKENMTRVISLVVADYLRPLEDQSRVNQINVEKIKASAKILLKVIRNALREDNSTADAYRKIRLNHPIIQKKIVQVPGAVDVLTVMGFAYCELEENGKQDKYLVFVPNENSLGLGNLVSIVLQEEIEKSQMREDVQKVTIVSTVTGDVTPVSKPKDVDDNDDQFLSQAERKKRNIKSKQVRKVKLAEKARAINRWEEDKESRMEVAKRKLIVKQDEKERVLGNDANQEDGNRNDSTIVRLENSTIQNSTNNNESLQSIRSKVAQAWKIKQHQAGGNEGHGATKKDMATTSLKSETIKNMAPATMAETQKDNQEEPSLSLPPPGEDDQKDDDDIVMESSLKPATKLSCSEDQMTAKTTTTENAAVEDMACPFPNRQPIELSPSWEDCLRSMPRCGPANGIRNSSTFYKKGKRIHTASSLSPKCFRRLFTEFEELKSSLPSNKKCSAWLRFDEETPQYIRALLTSPLPGPSPYSGGVFIFDIYVPDTYPLVPPKVNIINTGGGTVRFGPNLYADGKVCLSLLGTWPGPKWNQKHSSIHQVLVSIQSLLLGVEHPYFLEPGYGGWEAQVKEGDFASVGKTLAGDTVTEELTLPSKAWLYEDNIRLGSLRYAMLEPLRIVSEKRKGCGANADDDKDVHIKPALKYLLPFEDIIKAHFYHNGEETLVAVTAWLNAIRPTDPNLSHDGPLASTAPPLTQTALQGGKDYPTDVLKTMQTLFQKLDLCIRSVCSPSLQKLNKPSLVAVSTVANGSHSTTIDPEPTVDRVAALVINTPEKVQDENGLKKLKLLQGQMQEAANNMNFIAAGQIQKEIKNIEEMADLKRKMKQAALEGDFILAGTTQAKLKSLEDLQNNKSSCADDQSLICSDNGIDDDDAVDEENSDYDDDDGPNEEDYDEDDGFDDISEYGTKHGWGLGQPLNTPPEETEKTSACDEQSRKKAKKIIASSKPQNQDEAVIISRLPVMEPCRLRIRLPGSRNESIIGEFDSNEKLAVIYKWVKSLIPALPSSSEVPSPKLVQLPGIYNASGSQVISISGGAFANPQSLYGFTLITAHPKREYSLEMHSSTSLKDLGLTPSAMLTVMMCSSRGLVKRGALENKLATAQGDAMDVEDLGYEALQELVEKIGVASPGDGAWKGIDEITLEKISKIVSPKEFLVQKSSEEEDSKCPICLGEFDPNESDPQLRTLEHCHHTFHSSCLRTWFATKTNCPICNYSFNQV